MKSVEQLVAEAKEKAQKKAGSNQKLEVHEAAMLHAATLLENMRRLFESKKK